MTDSISKMRESGRARAQRTPADLDFGNDPDHQVRRVIIIEGCMNLLALLGKAAVGFSTGSLVVLSDAIHSLTDFSNNVIVWVVAKASSAPPDREHPYGHRRFETLAVFVLASLLTVLAFEVAMTALRTPQRRVTQHAWGVAVLVGVLLLNCGVSFWENLWARRLRSELLRADARHTLADVLVTSTVIVGWQLSARGYPWLDTVLVLAVSGLVLLLAYGLFRRAIPVLVGKIAVEPEVVMRVARSIDGVKNVQRVRSRWEGSIGVVDLVLTVESTLPTSAAHAIADRVEATLRDQLGIQDITIHIEPEGGSTNS